MEEMNKEQGMFLVALEDIKKLTETFIVQKEASVEMRKEIDELTLRFHDVCTEAAFKAEKAVSVRDRIKSVLSMSGKDRKETVMTMSSIERSGAKLTTGRAAKSHSVDERPHSVAPTDI